MSSKYCIMKSSTIGIPPPNITSVTKSRKVRWERQVACMGEGTGAYKVLVGKSEGKRPLGRTGWRSGDQMILLKMDLCSKWDGGHGIGQSASGEDKRMGSCEYGTKPQVPHNMVGGISQLVAQKLLASHERPWSQEIVSQSVSQSVIQSASHIILFVLNQNKTKWRQMRVFQTKQVYNIKR